MNHSQPVMDFYASALKSNLGMASNYLKSVRRMRQWQIDQIDASGLEHDSLLQQIDKASDADALRTCNADLLTTYTARVMEYWSGITRQMSSLQWEFAGALQNYELHAAEDLRHRVEQLQSSLTDGASSLLKPVFDPQALFDFGGNGHSDAAGMNHSAHGSSGYERATDVKPKPAPRASRVG